MRIASASLAASGPVWRRPQPESCWAFSWRSPRSVPALGVTALLLLYPRLPMVRIIGSDIAHAVPLTLVAGIGHWLIGSVDWVLLGTLLIGAVPGIVIGSFLASRVSEAILRTLLSVVLAVVATRLVFA